MKIAAIGHSPKLIGEINLPKLVDLLKTWLPVFEPTQIITGLHPHIDLALGIAGMEMRLPVRAMPTYYDAFAEWAPGVREWRGRVALYSGLGHGGYAVQSKSEESEITTLICNCNRIHLADVIFTFCMEGIPGGTYEALDKANIAHATVIDIWTPYFNA